MALAPFLEKVMADLRAEDALLVMAKGLGLHVVLHQLVAAHAAPEHLVLVLNASQEEERQLLHGLAVSGVGGTPPVVITNECSAADRVELYLAGGVLLVTSRILVVDMLSDRVPVEQLSGIVVANAHRVSESSNVAFIMRLYRQRNRHGFIKALSDDAHGFTRGFAKVEKVMRLLHVRRLHLWPRFHVEVAGALDGCAPQVDEVSVPLSARAARLQRALLEAVETCLAELRYAYARACVCICIYTERLLEAVETGLAELR